MTQQIRRCHLAGTTEMLAMPDEIVVEEQILRKLVYHRRDRIQDDFDHLIRATVSDHASRQLEAIGSAFREIINAVREEVSPGVAFGDEFLRSLRTHLAKGCDRRNAHRLHRACNSCRIICRQRRTRVD